MDSGEGYGEGYIEHPKYVEELLGDIILLEFQQDWYNAEQAKSKIVRPDVVKDKLEGPDHTKQPHHFKVVQIGPEVKHVQIGDVIFAKPPSLQNPGGIIGTTIMIDGIPTPMAQIEEKNVAGIQLRKFND